MAKQKSKEEKSDFQTILENLEKKYGLERPDPQSLTVISTKSSSLRNVLRMLAPTNLFPAAKDRKPISAGPCPLPSTLTP